MPWWEVAEAAGEEAWANAGSAMHAAAAAPTIRDVDHTPNNSRPPDGPTPEPKPTARRVPAMLMEFVEHTRREVEAAKIRIPFVELEALVAQEEPPRNFFAAVTRHASKAHMAVIAEIKRKSPSAGVFRPEYEGDGFSPEDIAQRYHRGGAAAISCATDERFYGGRLDFIRRIKAVTPLPVLRKDVLLDPWQVWESRAHGADAILLIAECIPEGTMVDMLILAHRLGMTTLLQVHTQESLLRVRQYASFPHPGYGLLGINNRDLTNGRVDVGHTLRLLEHVPDKSVLVSESGATTYEDVKRLRHQQVRIVLVGEHLLRQDDPEAALRLLVRGR
jgi:indole-3-glycerol phosphate synthase